MELVDSTPGNVKSRCVLGSEYIEGYEDSNNLKEKMAWYVDFISDNMFIVKKEIVSLSQSLAKIDINVTQAQSSFNNKIEVDNNPYVHFDISKLRKFVEKDKEFHEPIYVFEMKVSDSKSLAKKWTIKRTYADFQILYKDISHGYKEQKDLPKENKANRSELDDTLTKLVEWLSEAWQIYSDIAKKQRIASKDDTKNTKEFQKMCDFIQCYLSMARLGIWDYEKAGHLNKKMGSLKVKQCCEMCKFCQKQNICCCIWSPWATSILAINSTEIFYVKIKINHSIHHDKRIEHWQVNDTVMLDNQTSLYWKYRWRDSKLDFYIETSKRLFHCRTHSTHELIDWILAITNCIKQGKCETVNRFKSFAPIREHSWVKTYLLGHGYFEDVYQALEKANYRIFITDWFFSPTMYLKKPIEENEESQLCKVQFRAAKRGVKVYIQIWKEAFIMYQESKSYVKKFFENKDQPYYHPNIEVTAHNNYKQIWWSHHEKMILIDQHKLFMGGLDLCWGRNEYPGYWLFDYETDIGKTYYPGKDYYNGFEKEPQKPFSNNEDKSDIERNVLPRMPWRDVAGQFRGGCVDDAARHFIVYWNFAKRQNKESLGKIIDAPYLSKISEIEKQDSEAHKAIMEQYDYDLQVKSSEIMKQSQDAQNFPYFKDKLHHIHKAFHRKPHVMFKYTHTCQFLRSSCMWSTGVDRKECSIMNAYIELIKGAKHFIYIENQYFLSKISGSPCKNPILETLIDKIIEKISNKEKFRVIVLVPIEPEDPNSQLKAEGFTKRAILQYEYKAISRGDNSILGQISKHTKTPEDYIQFLALRNHGKSPITGEPHTTGIYVHTKLLMVDDDWMVFGSANLNDRSMVGSRDSEIAMCTYDTNRVTGVMDGQDCQYSNTVHNLRTQIFTSTFDMKIEEVDDPLDDDMWKVIAGRCKTNTEVYRKVFRCIPDDEIKKFDGKEIKHWQSRAELDKYDEEIVKVKGYACEFPHRFLEKDKNMTQDVYSIKASLMPEKWAC